MSVLQQSQNVPHNQKIQILRNLRSTGCRFKGDHLDLDQLELREMRISLGKKVPWLFIEGTINHVHTITKTDNVPRYLQDMLDGTRIIANTFVVKMIESNGHKVFDIEWSPAIQPFFVKSDGKKTHTIVTKDHIMQFCSMVFSAPTTVPKSENYPKVWFITLLVLQAAYFNDTLTDESIHKAQESLKTMNRKKKK
jgi:hypothetical protein